MMKEFDGVISSMNAILGDNTTPRTVRETLGRMISYLQEEEEDDQRKIATALSEIDDLAADVNIPPYIRTQLYGVSSQLEALNN